MESKSCLVCRKRKVSARNPLALMQVGPDAPRSERLGRRRTTVSAPPYRQPLTRQVKCDRTPGQCYKCVKFGAECTYEVQRTKPRRTNALDPHTSSDTTQAGLRRRRSHRSCVDCRRSKVKCSGDPLCERCFQKGLRCVYPNDETSSVRPIADAGMPQWLAARELPGPHHIRELIDVYLSRVHTVRCLGFLHIPTFMERFGGDEAFYRDRSGLICIICALAAPFFYAKSAAPSQDSSAAQFHVAGRGWAATAMELAFANFGNPAVDCLTVAVLLHEYHLRVCEHAKAFLVSGMVARHIQILQLNMEHDGDVLCEMPGAMPWTVKESRRRLFWACYLQDAFIECGISQLRFIAAEDAQIQLPCLEDYFLRGKPCLTELLPQGTTLTLSPRRDSLERGAESLDMRAFYIRLMSIRSKILYYVKSLGTDRPWEHGSRFDGLNRELGAIQDSMPSIMAMTTGNTYIYKSSGRLNVYFGMHILLAQTFNDLYRVGVAGLVFPAAATKWIRDNAPFDFIKRCHETCATKGGYIAGLLDELYRSDKESTVDFPYAMHAQVCSGVIVTTVYAWRAISKTALLPDVGLTEYRRMLHTTVRLLKHLRQYMVVDLFLESAIQSLKHFDDMTEQQVHLEEDEEAPRQASLDYILNPLGVYPIARTQASEKHKPEQFKSPATDSPGESESDTFVSTGLWDWEFPAPYMAESMGYPTFLDYVS